MCVLLDEGIGWECIIDWDVGVRVFHGPSVVLLAQKVAQMLERRRSARNVVSIFWKD